MRRRIYVEPENISRFDDKLWIVRKLKLPDAMRLKPMSAPDALDRADQNAGGHRHQSASKVRRHAEWIIKRQGDDPRGDFIAQLRDGHVLSRSRPSKPYCAKRSRHRRKHVF